LRRYGAEPIAKFGFISHAGRNRLAEEGRETSAADRSEEGFLLQLNLVAALDR
jgi:hypothetical protein